MWVEKPYMLHTHSQFSVILLVRMWVEKILVNKNKNRKTSSSLWGCELKSVRFHWLGFAQHVILLVRMWVEKWSIWNTYRQGLCHPPCEDVSWKGLLPKSFALSASSSSLWGCELKNPFYTLLLCCKYRHPPCEDVSWKSNLVYIILWLQCHPPCEDVSWKTIIKQYSLIFFVILLVRMWVEKSYLYTCVTQSLVILLVRMWVEKFPYNI